MNHSHQWYHLPVLPRYCTEVTKFQGFCAHDDSLRASPAYRSFELLLHRFSLHSESALCTTFYTRIFFL